MSERNANQPTQKRLLRQPPLADQVYEILAQRITSKTYSPGERLPPESQLAEELDVSRATIRSAFARLAGQGLIRRRPGSGTYVAKLPSIANPLHQFVDMEQRIADHGFKAGFRQLKAEIIPADPRVAELLDLQAGSPVLHVQKVFTADGNPVILFKNYIPTWVFQGHLSLEEVTRPGFTEPFFEFFSEKCRHSVKYLISSIRPEIVGNCDLADIFPSEDPSMPILLVEDVGYDEEERQVFFSIEHLAGIASRFDLVRQVESF